MKADLTRDTFDPRRHFSRVLMQQGRVQLDADWNEQAAILLHYVRTLAKDILGRHAGPTSHLGFEVIGNGMLTSTQLDSKLASIEPDAERRSVLRHALAKGDFIIGPGRYYVEGLLVENERALLYSEQVGYPFNSLTTLQALEEFDRSLLFYLDVWERHITFVEDDRIREVALGGPDTCARAQVVWQIKALLAPDDDSAVLDCGAVANLLPVGTGKLRARARRDKPTTELCVIPPESRYRGAENQLYRVEVHRGGDALSQSTGATFKWSRENGSVTFPIRSLAAGRAVLEHLGRDLHLSLKPGDWVEVLDEAIALGEQAGPLAQVESVNRDELSVNLKLPDGVSSLPSYDEADLATKRPLLRRWDHAGDPKTFAGALQIKEQDSSLAGLKAGWLELEDGVQIWFAKGGEYRPGDYWLIPARTASGEVEWPDELASNGELRLDMDGNPIADALEPHGPRHYYAPVSLAAKVDDTDQRQLRDCRCRIDHLPCVRYLYAFAGQGIGPNF